MKPDIEPEILSAIIYSCLHKGYGCATRKNISDEIILSKWYSVPDNCGKKVISGLSGTACVIKTDNIYCNLHYLNSEKYDFFVAGRKKAPLQHHTW